MSNHKNLVWFNKEGDYLNFNYNDSLDRFEGDILFHENSSDTYKTYGLYMMEKVSSFKYELPGYLTTKKFQLFNEYGIHFYSSKYKNENILGIEPVNNDVNFTSKWIYGDLFEKKFPIGTIVVFDSEILEFTNINKTYVVVGTKKNAIMIIGQVDNRTFEVNYYGIYDDPSIYNGKTISGVNSLGIYDYINIEDLSNNLSGWSEPDFYDSYYIGKKLNIVNSQNNDGILTIDNIDLYDIEHIEYNLNKNELPFGTDLILELKIRTDLPSIYKGNMVINDDYTININKYPSILKPGTEFKIVRGNLSDLYFTVEDIPEWTSINKLKYFATQSQVVYNNKIYEAIVGYTHSFGIQNTSYITPEDTNYWGEPTHIKVIQPTISENVLDGEIFLTTDTFYFDYLWNGTSSSAIMLASFAEKYKDDFLLFNADLYYHNNTLKVDLIYPSDYLLINFYYTSINPIYLIGNQIKKVENLIGVEENLNYELNYDYSENFLYNIVFTNIDEYGIKIYINGMLYEEEIKWVYSGITPDMDRTIDRTLRSWLFKYYIRLNTLGINVDLQYTGNYISLFYNSIKIETQYPNVPINLEKVLVGTTANYYIEHSNVIFNDLGPYLNIRINDNDYGIKSSYVGNVVDVIETLHSWVNLYSNELLRYGIIINNINNSLVFNVLELDRRLVYSINTGKIDLPGIDDYTIIRKIKGNHGSLISSNEVLLPSIVIEENPEVGFESYGFSTGMVFSINNTLWPFVNQEYVIQYLDQNVINLSYEGPFWGLIDSICLNSPFTTVAFDYGFGQTGCGPIVVETDQFDPDMFSAAFSIKYNKNEYTINNINLSSYISSTVVDIMYAQISDSVYILTEDSIVVLDVFTTNYIKTIDLLGNIGSIKLLYNKSNNYIYCISSNKMWIINPTSNVLSYSINLTNSPNDIAVNENGDIYVTYNTDFIHIWYLNNFTSNPSKVINSSTPNWPLGITTCGKMVCNELQENMYITTDSNHLLRINSNREIQVVYEIPGLTDYIYYEPIYDSVYVFGNYLYRILIDDSIETIGLIPQSFIQIIFNNITGQINISDSNGNLTLLDLINNYYTQENVLEYGYMSINQLDGNLYISTQNNEVLIVNPNSGSVVETQQFSNLVTKLIYNPERKSIWGIQPNSNSLIEINVILNSTIVPELIKSNLINDSLYGTLDPNYTKKKNIWLKTRDYIRIPKENYNGDVKVKYYWRWLYDDRPEFFMYDFSGNQLPTSGSYSYIGPKPLTDVVLNKKPNTDISKIYIPQYQQTIFDIIEYTLPYIDDSYYNKKEVEPLQLFLGFKSIDEGYLESKLQLFKKEEIDFEIISDINTNISFDMVDDYGIIKINTSSDQYFTGRGLKPGQIIVIYLYDITNNTNQYTSYNHASMFIIRNVYTKSLILDFINEGDYLLKENTIISDYPNVSNITYLKFRIKVKDKEIARFNVYGQTEDEDERFKIELGNVGKLVNPDEVFIFKEYDILEGGIDWKILNRKRKEMLIMKNLIYPYIGSYKSIINAINYFGYNDLKLNEYYRNINPNSENFLKLFKVEIPEIFDNSIEGWVENDFIKNTYPNSNYEETNLFNLSYDITDKEGTNILEYTIDEIIIKLQGLKYWLKRNVIPLTHKILDITGQAWNKRTDYILHKVHDVQIISIKENMTPVSFKMNESYLMPINSGSTIYNCVLDFYSIIPGIGHEDYYTENPKPYNNVELTMPDSYEIKIRTYKTYKEWDPFKTYSIGDKVKYYQKLYRSEISSNITNNPRKYESVLVWSANISYNVSSIVEYNRDYYVYSQLGSTQSITPDLDTENWLKITEWKEIDMEPVQILNEFRVGEDLSPYNFTVDSSIDPFIVIEVTSDNGYGEIYRDRKNYEIK